MVTRAKVINISKLKGRYVKHPHIKTKSGYYAAIPDELLNHIEIGDIVTIYSSDKLSIGGFSAIVIETPSALLNIEGYNSETGLVI